MRFMSISHLEYLGHSSPLSAHGQPVAGVLHVAAGDGGVGLVVRAEDGGPHLEVAVRGVGLLSGQQALLAQPLMQVRLTSSVSKSQVQCSTVQ